MTGTPPNIPRPPHAVTDSEPSSIEQRCPHCGRIYRRYYASYKAQSRHLGPFKCDGCGAPL